MLKNVFLYFEPFFRVICWFRKRNLPYWQNAPKKVKVKNTFRPKNFVKFFDFLIFTFLGAFCRKCKFSFYINIKFLSFNILQYITYFKKKSLPLSRAVIRVFFTQKAAQNKKAFPNIFIDIFSSFKYADKHVDF